MNGTLFVVRTQMIITAFIMTLYLHGVSSIRWAQLRSHDELAQLPRFVPVLRQIATELASLRYQPPQPGSVPDVMTPFDFSSVPVLEAATKNTLLQAHRRLLHLGQPPAKQQLLSKLASPLPKTGITGILLLAVVSLLPTTYELMCSGRLSRPTYVSGGVTLIVAAVTIVDLLRRQRAIAVTQREVAIAAACLLTDHLLTPWHRSVARAKRDEVDLARNTLSEQDARLQAELTEIREPIEQLSRVVGRVSDDLRALVTEIEACTGSFDELERPPGILVDSNVTLNSGDMTHQVGKWYEKLQLEIQSSLQDLEQATAALVTTELAKVGANTGSGLLLSINDELATTLQELSVGATEAFSSEVAQNLAPTFELTRDVQLATTELLRAVDEFVGASEKCKECVAHLQALPYLLERIP